MTSSPPGPAGAIDTVLRLDQVTDERLIALVRDGNTDAFGELWIRHEHAARAVANRLSLSSADDLVAESFAKILRLLQAGKGPDDGFRAYLNTCIRNLHVDSLRRDGRIVPLQDEQDLTSFVAPVDDALDAGPVAERAASAWQSLNARDRWLTWAAAVEGYTTAEIADRLDVRANTAAVWLHRARASLRTAFLEQYVQDASDPVCSRQRTRFASYLRGQLSDGRRRQLQEHLMGCADCRAVLAETAQVNARLRAAAPLLPIAVGAGLLTWLGGAKAGLGGAKAGLGGTIGSGTSSASGGTLIGAVSAVAAVAVIGAALALAPSGGVHNAASTALLRERPTAGVPVSTGPSVPATATATTAPRRLPSVSIPPTGPTPGRTRPSLAPVPTPSPSADASSPTQSATSSSRPAPATRRSTSPAAPSSSSVPVVLPAGQASFLVPVPPGMSDPTLTVTLPVGWTVTAGRIGPWVACAPGGRSCQFALGTLTPRMYLVRVTGRGPVGDDRAAVLVLASAGRTILTLTRPLR